MITTAAAVLYSAAGLIRLHAFRLGTSDLVIFDQAVRSYSRFGLPVSIAKGVHNDFGPDFSVLGDHWSPILASLAPFYWLHDGPEILLVLQGVRRSRRCGCSHGGGSARRRPGQGPWTPH
ncbi:DUF2079 domain-containing protein [Microtetraspora malaysiensis]|uniref:DUF2079 domain-containing protein n=1 Tax=Microtetraspora malaysiensis TaxID=161358 RepID=UPI003D8D7B3F